MASLPAADAQASWTAGFGNDDNDDHHHDTASWRDQLSRRVGDGETSTGATSHSHREWDMIRRALPAILALLGLSLSFAPLEQAAAAESATTLSPSSAELYGNVESDLLVRGLPVVTLLEGRRLPTTQLGRMGTTTLDVVPLAFLKAVEVQKGPGPSRYSTEAPGGVVDLRLNRMQSGGEVGFFYGKSSGKYGREEYSAYIIGGVGNEKFNITAGAAYTETSWRVPSGRR